MSRGKYSPTVCGRRDPPNAFSFNCYGKVPAENVGEYDEKTMFADYDSEGYDRYGYSAFDADGNYRFGGGVDRNGITEDQYLIMSDEEFSRYG